MNQLINRTPQAASLVHADPIISVIALFEVIKAHSEWELPSRPNEMLVEAVLEVLGLVAELRGLEFWDSLKFGLRIPSRWVGDAVTRRTQREMLRAHIVELRSRSVNDGDIRTALDLACEVVDRMSAEFSLGLVAEEAPVPLEIRFKCAALIPVLSQQFTEVWLPLRANTGYRTTEKRRAVPRGN
jgi:hypothetical protein